MYNKIVELEKRIQSLDGGSAAAVPTNLSGRIDTIELNQSQFTTTFNKKITEIEDKLVPKDIVAKVTALENRKIPADLTERVSAIESKQMPPDLSVRVSAIEAKLAEFNSLNLQEIKEKINNYDVTIASLKQAIVALDDQVETLKNQ